MWARQGRFTWSLLGRAVLALLAGLVAAQFAGLAFGAFSYMVGVVDESEDVDWGRQPLEIFADPEQGCVLNVEGVAPGRHEVVAFAEGETAKVIIRDPAGKVLFEQSAEPASETAARVRFVRLRELGTHRVECRSGDEVAAVDLHVRPADELAQE